MGKYSLYYTVVLQVGIEQKLDIFYYEYKKTQKYWEVPLVLNKLKSYTRLSNSIVNNILRNI